MSVYTAVRLRTRGTVNDFNKHNGQAIGTPTNKEMENVLYRNHDRDTRGYISGIHRIYVEDEREGTNSSLELVCDDDIMSPIKERYGLMSLNPVTREYPAHDLYTVKEIDECFAEWGCTAPMIRVGKFEKVCLKGVPLNTVIIVEGYNLYDLKNNHWLFKA